MLNQTFIELMVSGRIEYYTNILAVKPPKNKDIKVFVRCDTGTFDPDYKTEFREYERSHEILVNKIVSGIFAPDEDTVAYMMAAGWTAPIYNVSGVPFAKPTQCLTQEVVPFNERPMVVAFCNTLDEFHQPHWLMDLVEEYKKVYPDVVFKILSTGPLQEGENGALQRAHTLRDSGILEIHDSLSTDEHFHHLSYARVLFSCSRRKDGDQYMNTADAIGCNLLYPAVRGFPEMFAHDPNRLYIPWSEDDPFNKLSMLLHEQHHNTGLVSDWNSKTNDRMISIMCGDGEEWRRHPDDYRKHSLHAKYQVVKIEDEF